mmetsp:Transcript_41952/g.133251  ORF Transcript_41952/g.133251 Transcript_41952/m.133251 type:complete len:309 (+) Transcript_41952:157-1083(+)
MMVTTSPTWSFSICVWWLGGGSKSAMATSVGSLLRVAPRGCTSVTAKSLLFTGLAWALNVESARDAVRWPPASASAGSGASAMAGRLKKPPSSVSASMSLCTCFMRLRFSTTRGGDMSRRLSASCSLMTLRSLVAWSTPMDACISFGSVSSMRRSSRSVASRKSVWLCCRMRSRLMIICSWLKRFCGSITAVMPPLTSSSFRAASRSASVVCMDSESRWSLSTRCRMFCMRKSQRFRLPQALTYSMQASEKSGSRSCSCCTRSKSLAAWRSMEEICSRMRLVLESSWPLAAWSSMKPRSCAISLLFLA